MIGNDKLDTSEERSSNYPGHQFKKAREAKGLSQEQVAQNIRLPITVIQALETGDFSSSKGQVFDRGYIRLYARYLNISDENILMGYTMLMGNDNFSAPPTVLEVKSTVAKKQLKDPGVIGVTLVVIISLLAILAWWWNTQNKPMETVQVDSVTVKDSQGIDQVELLSNSTDRVTDTDIDNESNPILDESALAVDNWREINILSPNENRQVTQGNSSSILDAEGNLSDANFGITQRTQTNELRTTIDEIAQQSNVNLSNVDIDTNVNNGFNAVNPQIDSALSSLDNLQDDRNEVSALLDPNTLKIVFTQDCWVEIIDSDGEKVLVGLFSGGRTVETPVKTPARVLLGRGSAIAEFNYDGRNIDLEPYTRKDVVRFTLKDF